MTVNEVKEFLRRGFLLDKQVKAKYTQITHLRALQTSVSQTPLTHAGARRGSPAKDHIGDIVVNLCELIDLYHEDVTRLLRLKSEIRAAIASVASEQYRLLLSLRYESYETWEEIALEMCYCYQHIHRIHGEALKHVIVCDSFL